MGIRSKATTLTNLSYGKASESNDSSGILLMPPKCDSAQLKDYSYHSAFAYNHLVGGVVEQSHGRMEEWRDGREDGGNLGFLKEGRKLIL